MRNGHGRYESGQLRCSICSIFIFTNPERNVCPCCNTRLRTRPKGMKFKRKFRNRISIQSRDMGTIQNIVLA
jgi:hypothetical protein